MFLSQNFGDLCGWRAGPRASELSERDELRHGPEPCYAIPRYFLEPLLADFHCAKGPRRFSWLLRWIFSGHVTWRRKIFSFALIRRRSGEPFLVTSTCSFGRFTCSGRVVCLYWPGVLCSLMCAHSGLVWWRQASAIRYGLARRLPRGGHDLISP